MPSEFVEILPTKQHFDSSTWPEGWDGYSWIRYGDATCGDCVHYQPCPNDECEMGVCDLCLYEKPDRLGHMELWWVRRSESWCGMEGSFEAVPR